MSFPASPLALRIEIHLAGVWEDITGYVLTEEDITISRGRADWAADVDPGECGFILDNRGGRFSPRNPRSEYFGRLTRNTPIRVGVQYGSATLWRFHGEVSAWPSRWDLSQSMQWAPIKSFGPLRRWRAASTPLKSALHRHIMASAPRAYWPLTDGPQTQNARSEVGGNIVYATVLEGDSDAQPQWASFDLAAHMEPIAQTPEGVTRGFLRGYVRGNNRPTSFAVDFLRAGMGGFDSFGIELEAAGTDPDHFLHLGFDHTQKDLIVSLKTITEETGSTVILGGPFAQPAAYTDEPHMFRLAVDRLSASTAQWRVIMDGREVGIGTFALPPRGPVRWGYDYWVPDDQLATTVALGHVVVWDGATAPPPADVLSALAGYAGETAGERIARVSGEAGIPLEFVGDPADTAAVGPQGLAAPLELLGEAARVDGGILYESRESLSLVYRTCRSRYNRGHTLAP